MAITEHDLELFAARIRPQFPGELRDTAYELALSIARVVGSKVKLLSPETTIDTILEWSGATFLAWSGPAIEDGADSLDQVDQIMALEEEFGGGFVVPHALAHRTDEATFREWVELEAGKRRVT
jgi:hypothetical protein